ncbi:MAG: WD40 repeat domain-containing protein [Phycisphaerae bacterium]|nr:WD40 repeat domain-containing protein [Phycisphaerae bacterium]
MRKFFICFCSVIFLSAGLSLAVTSKVTRHKSAEQMLKGKSKDVVISSEGVIRLGLAAEVLKEEFEDVWSINAIVVSGSSVFLGTSPNGGIYEYSLGEFREVYRAQSAVESVDVNEVETADVNDSNGLETADVNDSNEPEIADVNDSNEVEQQEILANEHIFAMAKDLAGRVLAGISGDGCRLVRVDGEKVETIFEPNGCRYIFSIAVGYNGDIILGTGPEGKVFKLNSFGEDGEEIYDSSDKNIMSVVFGDDGKIYAGSDSRGLVYRIDAAKKDAEVVYDSDQDEIISLVRGSEGEIFAAGTSANIVNTQISFASRAAKGGGRPDLKGGKKTEQTGEGGIKLNIANTVEENKANGGSSQVPSLRGRDAEKESVVYRISGEGFVTDVFGESAVFFTMVSKNGELLVGSGNDAKLFGIDIASEEARIVFEDDKSAQLTALAVEGDAVYIGTANPAKLVRIAGDLAIEGSYESDLIDAGQPAKWGKLQIEADIPAGAEVMVSSRSGNVGDVNDESFSEWTEPIAVKGPVQLRCPAGRFCQYKLIFRAGRGSKSAVVREVAVAHTVPNLAPKVESVIAAKIEGKPEKEGLFKIDIKASDKNNDKLIYTIEFRKVGREGWIELEEDIEKPVFEWDARTVEDGRYELRVTASDERSNSEATKMVGSRISDVVTVDNTGPLIIEEVLKAEGGEVILGFKAVDKFSAIGEVAYTLDSNEKWTNLLPQDMVFDTTEEEFSVRIDSVESGEHVLALRAKDAAGNVSYKTFDILMKDRE